MVQGIEGVFQRIQEINARIDEIKSFGAANSVTQTQTQTQTQSASQTATDANGLTFDQVLQQIMLDRQNAALTGDNTSQLSALASLVQTDRPVNTPVIDDGSDESAGNYIIDFGASGTPSGLQESRNFYNRLYSGQSDMEHVQDIIDEASQKFGVDASLIKAVIKQESQFEPNAVSHAGAQGLMQLMPQTAELLGVTDPFDVRQNVFGGTKYLKMLLDKYNNNLPLSLAAYNAGSNRVDNAGTVPAIPETQDYVLKVLQYYDDFRNL